MPTTLMSTLEQGVFNPSTGTWWVGEKLSSDEPTVIAVTFESCSSKNPGIGLLPTSVGEIGEPRNRAGDYSKLLEEGWAIEHGEFEARLNGGSGATEVKGAERRWKLEGKTCTMAWEPAESRLCFWDQEGAESVASREPDAIVVFSQGSPEGGVRAAVATSFTKATIVTYQRHSNAEWAEIGWVIEQRDATSLFNYPGAGLEAARAEAKLPYLQENAALSGFLQGLANFSAPQIELSVEVFGTLTAEQVDQVMRVGRRRQPRALFLAADTPPATLEELRRDYYPGVPCLALGCEVTKETYLNLRGQHSSHDSELHEMLYPEVSENSPPEGQPPRTSTPVGSSTVLYENSPPEGQPPRTSTPAGSSTGSSPPPCSTQSPSDALDSEIEFIETQLRGYSAATTTTPTPIGELRKSPRWVSNQERAQCMQETCDTSLRMGNRHHCRSCGRLMCSSCMSTEDCELNSFLDENTHKRVTLSGGRTQAQKVCKDCQTDELIHRETDRLRIELDQKKHQRLQEERRQAEERRREAEKRRREAEKRRQAEERRREAEKRKREAEAEAEKYKQKLRGQADELRAVRCRTLDLTNGSLFSRLTDDGFSKLHELCPGVTGIFQRASNQHSQLITQVTKQGLEAYRTLNPNVRVLSLGHELSRDKVKELLQQYSQDRRLNLCDPGFAELTPAGLSEISKLCPEVEAIFVRHHNIDSLAQMEFEKKLAPAQCVLVGAEVSMESARAIVKLYPGPNVEALEALAEAKPELSEFFTGEVTRLKKSTV